MMNNQEKYHPGQPPQPSYPSQNSYPPQQQVLQRAPFNAEEQKAFRECIKEAFYYRCVPFSFIGSAVAYIGLKAGYLKENSRFGFAPKMMGVALIGFVLGKLSYQNACAEKLMRLPNSPVGEALRKRKSQVGFQETLSPESGYKMDEKWDGNHQDGLVDATGSYGPDEGSPQNPSFCPEGRSQPHGVPSNTHHHSSSSNYSYSPSTISEATTKKNSYGDDVYV
ncbi:unnamed protein product [Meganyctiphanes norvegica]|uniref:OCIA domain-containing protein n=1 Tax=Meganyctiphanes norvegica TaxID=48144 RepID=A0AAV2Q3X0_MEGNR